MNLLYENIEHLLLPSLRKDYKDDKYYNAFNFLELKQKATMKTLKKEETHAQV